MPIAALAPRQDGARGGAKLHPLQEPFLKPPGLQCGFSTPGMILSAFQLLRRDSKPTEDGIRVDIAGNLCRCTGYQNILKAIGAASEEMRSRAGKQSLS